MAHEHRSGIPASLRLGTNLRRWRINAGLSQAQAALRIDVQLGTYSTWELGKIYPSELSLKKISAATSLQFHTNSAGDDA